MVNSQNSDLELVQRPRNGRREARLKKVTDSSNPHGGREEGRKREKPTRKTKKQRSGGKDEKVLISYPNVIRVERHNDSGIFRRKNAEEAKRTFVKWELVLRKTGRAKRAFPLILRSAQKTARSAKKKRNENERCRN